MVHWQIMPPPTKNKTKLLDRGTFLRQVRIREKLIKLLPLFAHYHTSYITTLLYKHTSKRLLVLDGYAPF